MVGKKCNLGNVASIRRYIGLVLSGVMLSGCVAMPGKVSYIVKDPSASSRIVATADGSVRGVVSPRGQAFLGIPFAAPPVGELRFAPPAPVIPWHRARAADSVGPACPQSVLLAAGNSSEDCLTLNVYAPHNAGQGMVFPVMVWLYGGALALGSNAQYDPSLLAERQGVIVVAPNYRVGALGFLAHPALRGPGEGNYGVLDQQAALRWVKRNIAAFGGDPGNVTLFGESAGALSACVHLLLPGSRGLFQRAILQSDSCAQPDTSLPMAEAEAGGLMMARDLGCGDGHSALACLRRLPAEKLYRATSHRRGNGGRDGWAPMTGGDVLPKPPDQAFAAGEGAAVPVLMGSNRDEGRLFANVKSFSFALSTRRAYEDTVASALPGDIAPVLKEYAGVAAGSYYQAFADIVTDSHFACPILTMSRLLGGRAAFYAYEFDDPRAPMSLPRAPFTPAMGSYHAAEIAYVFQRPWALGDPNDFDLRQQALAGRIQHAWGTFAHTSQPAGNPAWLAFDGARPYALSAQRTGYVEDFARRHRCAFWNARGY
ncbi:carboxylesterase/lipase family protein [Acerihabitans arboris]|uniref:Carboxylic ester hydrolase n=1 Tax=Acerihabitans arboris TaxID=2691583 RepID=A0A845SK19_9GAMM|nr:carboxylesterase family protein [Acerihabitans arboris]NDL62948.1 carboxylesterase family protein [Acerihabitans arboris]